MTTARFIHKPLKPDPIEAIQWIGKNKNEIEKFLVGTIFSISKISYLFLYLSPNYLITNTSIGVRSITNTPTGIRSMKIYDMLIKTSDNEVYICDIEYFNGHYKALDQEEE